MFKRTRMKELAMNSKFSNQSFLLAIDFNVSSRVSFLLILI